MLAPGTPVRIIPYPGLAKKWHNYETNILCQAPPDPEGACRSMDESVWLYVKVLFHSAQPWYVLDTGIYRPLPVAVLDPILPEDSLPARRKARWQDCPWNPTKETKA